MNPLPNVLIYRRELLPYSETFIRAQGEALTRYTAHYAGLHDVRGLALPAERSHALSHGSPAGRLRVLNYRLTRWDPFWMESLRRVRPALLHAHFEWGGKDALPLARALGVPLLTTCHGRDVTEGDGPGPFRRRLHAGRRQRLQREGRLFLAVSRFIERRMLARGYPPERVRVHHIGVDTREFAPLSFPEEPRPTAARPRLVVFIGRLVEKKGCEYLVRAVADLPRAEFGDVRLVIIGDGPLRDELETLARTLCLGRRCRFLGVRTPGEVRGWLARARLFSLPSVTAADGDSEGMGIVNLEAQSMGVPVVGFDHGGIGEAVAHGVTGLLCPERDWRTLAANLVALLRDDARWREMSQAARQRTVERFDLRTQTNMLEAIYDEIARQPKHASVARGRPGALAATHA